MNVVLVPISGIEQAWPAARRYLLPAIGNAGGRCGEQDIREDCEAGRLHLWIFVDDDMSCCGSAVTAFDQYPGFKVLSIRFLGAVDFFGSFLEEVFRTWQRFASDTGCRLMELTGRRGWKRALELYGWRERFVVLECEVHQDVEDRQNAGIGSADDRGSPVGNGQVEPAHSASW